MSERHVACFDVSPLLLKRALGMPETATVYGAQWDFGADALRVFVIDESLPLTPEGCVPRLVRATITEEHAEDGSLKARTWKWDV